MVNILSWCHKKLGDVGKARKIVRVMLEWLEF